MNMELKMREGDALPKINKIITSNKIKEYAHASGDLNPIHIDPEYAATSKFGSIIAHGMLIASSISEMMTLAFKQMWVNNGRLKIRFNSPVRAGDTITTFGQIKTIDNADEAQKIICSVTVCTQDGDTAISGEAIVTISN